MRNTARPVASHEGRGPGYRWLRSLGVQVGTRDEPRVLSQFSRVRGADLSAEGGGGREGGRQVRVPRTVVYEWRRVGNPRKVWPWRMLLAQRNSACSLPEAGARQMSHRFPQPTLASSFLVSCRHTLPFFCLFERLPFLFPPPCAPAAVAAPLMCALSLVLLHPHPYSALQPRRVRVSAHRRSALLRLRCMPRARVACACVARVCACCNAPLCAAFTRVRGCVIPQRAEARRCSRTPMGRTFQCPGAATWPARWKQPPLCWRQGCSSDSGCRWRARICERGEKGCWRGAGDDRFY